MTYSRLLILGGTGFVGRALCDKLVERSGGGSASVLVPSRRPQRAKHLGLLPTIRLEAADVHDQGQLVRLLHGRDAVVNLVAQLHGSEAAFNHAHVELPLKLVKACAAAGVRRIVHVSALGVTDDDAPLPSRYLRSKAEGERVLKASGLDVTILRPSVIFGEHDRFLNLFARLQSFAPVLPLAGAGARFQPVWVQDVAEAIIRCLDDPLTARETFECTGPTVYTLRQLAQFAGRCAGHERPVIGLPDALARLQAGVMEILPGEPLMSRDNLDSMKVANVATGRLPGLKALGIQPDSLESIAPGYLGAGQGVARLNRWRARSGGG